MAKNRKKKTAAQVESEITALSESVNTASVVENTEGTSLRKPAEGKKNRSAPGRKKTKTEKIAEKEGASSEDDDKSLPQAQEEDTSDIHKSDKKEDKPKQRRRRSSYAAVGSEPFDADIGGDGSPAIPLAEVTAALEVAAIAESAVPDITEERIEEKPKRKRRRKEAKDTATDDAANSNADGKAEKADLPSDIGLSDEDEDVSIHETTEEAAQYEAFVADFRRTVADMLMNAKSLSQEGESETHDEIEIKPDYDRFTEIDDDISNYVELEEDDESEEGYDEDEPTDTETEAVTANVFDAVLTDVTEDGMETPSDSAPEELSDAADDKDAAEDDSEVEEDADVAAQTEKKKSDAKETEEVAEDDAEDDLPSAVNYNPDGEAEEAASATEEIEDDAAQSDTSPSDEDTEKAEDKPEPIAVIDIFASNDHSESIPVEEETPIEEADESSADPAEEPTRDEAEDEASDFADGPTEGSAAEAEEMPEINGTAARIPVESRRSRRRFDPENPKITDFIYDTLETVVFMVLVALTIATFFVRFSQVSGSSMESTLYDGDLMLISNLFYTPARGDIVVFEDKDVDESSPLVKRVIGIAGDTVRIERGASGQYELYLNGELLDEDYVYINGAHYSDPTGEWTVGEGEVFVLGDHRNVSRDSREFGTVRVDGILGRVLIRIYPFDSFGTVD